MPTTDSNIPPEMMRALSGETEPLFCNRVTDEKAATAKDPHLLMVIDACFKHQHILKGWEFLAANDTGFSDEIAADFFQSGDIGRRAKLYLTRRELRMIGQDVEKIHRVVYFKMRIMAELAGIEVAEHDKP